MPVHPQVAAHLEPTLQRILVARPGGREQCVERRLEVVLFMDPSLDCCELLGPLDAVTDLARDVGVAMRMARRDLGGLT